MSALEAIAGVLGGIFAAVWVLDKILRFVEERPDDAAQGDLFSASPHGKYPGSEVTHNVL
ncbi:MAG: hypothetical protein ACRD3F_12180 [Acidobacteriaceae bacterium]